MTRIGASGLLDTSTITGNPRRAIGYFLLGATAAAFVKSSYFYRMAPDNKTFILNKRVAENEQTHAILRMVRYHVATRKMGVWDVNPQ